MNKNLLPHKISFFLFSFFSLISIFSSVAIAEQTAEFPHKCRAKNQKVDLKVIIGDIEKYRNGESPVIESKGELISCLEALPILKKYMLDPDANIRNLLAEFLGYFLFSNRLPIFLKQIETYPLDTNSIRFANYYPCRQFRRVQSKALTNALIKRVKSLDNDFLSGEFYILGCVARKDSQAKRFLEEMRKTTFQHKLSAGDRDAQLRDVNYALAEVGDADAEKLVLADFENSKNDEKETLEFLLATMRGFTNCRILLPLSSLILDERNVPASYLGEAEKNMRIGDLAISVFPTLMEKNVEGKAATERKPHTIEKRREIYQQTQIKLRKSSTCRSQ